VKENVTAGRSKLGSPWRGQNPNFRPKDSWATRKKEGWKGGGKKDLKKKQKVCRVFGERISCVGPTVGRAREKKGNGEK